MLSLQTFTSIVQLMSAAAQGATKTVLDLTVGSVLRAIIEANASIVMWLQWLLVQLMGRQRLATSTGIDVDSFIADFGMTRLPAVPATGSVTFSRFSYATTTATVPIGAVVITADGTQQFATTAAATLPPGTQSATVPIASITSGSASNVQPNSITLLGQAIPGIDTVNNTVGTTGGTDVESDASVKARFSLYILGLSKATLWAVESAIANVQQGLTYYVQENVSAVGTYQAGNFVVTVDDGSGAPPTALLNAVYTAVDAVRPITSTFEVLAPTEKFATVNLKLTLAPSVQLIAVQGVVAEALTQYINSLPVGTSLGYLALSNAAFNSLPPGQILNITGMTINGTATDLTVTPTQVVKTASVTVN